VSQTEKKEGRPKRKMSERGLARSVPASQGEKRHKEGGSRLEANRGCRKAVYKRLPGKTGSEGRNPEKFFGNNVRRNESTRGRIRLTRAYKGSLKKILRRASGGTSFYEEDQNVNPWELSRGTCRLWDVLHEVSMDLPMSQ